MSLFSDSALARITRYLRQWCWLLPLGIPSPTGPPFTLAHGEAILFVGVVFTALALSCNSACGWMTAAAILRHCFWVGCASFYGAIGLAARSGLVWLFFLLALGNWFGQETGCHLAGWGLLAGHELSAAFCAVRWRAAGALFMLQSGCFSAGCLPSVRPWA